MGGDKPGRMLAGHRLIDHAVAWARRHSSVVALATRAGQDGLGTGLIQLMDRDPTLGPIAALDSALRFARDGQFPAVLLVGCDMPFLPDTLLQRLLPALTGRRAAMPSSSGHLQPMATLWAPDVPALDAYVAAGGRSLLDFAREGPLAMVHWAEAPDPFVNVNDPDDLMAAAIRQARLRATTR